MAIKDKLLKVNFLALLALTQSCYTPERAVVVEKIFTVKDCEVFRFRDEGVRYFAKCSCGSGIIK